MAYEAIKETIRVLAEFKNGKVTPLLFDWKAVRHTVKKVNLLHFKDEGRKRISFFSVSTDRGEYLISYDPVSHVWKLEETYLEGG